MRERNAKTKATPRDLKDFTALKPYMDKVAMGTLRRHRMFSLCVKASVCKCFEFNLAAQHFAKSKCAFFAIGTLRGICEDLIVLRYLKGMPSGDREALVKALSAHELSTRVKLQDAFFMSIRPQQPVVRLKEVDKTIASSEAAARAVWNRHGWPKLQNGAMPQIRQIAEKQGLAPLAILYDYLYRLTSAGVHFTVQGLLRTGWGPNLQQCRFSTMHFHPYFADYCSLYGAFMFCLYFEFFASVLRPGVKERAVVDKIRADVLFTRRWPEMVTYEEMNMKPPADGETARMIVSALQAAARKRLVSKSVNYTDRRSAERRLVLRAFKALKSADRSRAK